jgi:DNA-binding response OmpR family regulator
VLDVHISNLRKKIGEGYIRTIRGVGYVIDRQAPAPAVRRGALK